MLDKILHLLFDNDLNNANGLFVDGVFNFPKHILTEAMAEDLSKTSTNDERNANDSSFDFRPLIHHIDLNHFSIAFADEMVCLKIKVEKTP